MTAASTVNGFLSSSQLSYDLLRSSLIISRPRCHIREQTSASTPLPSFQSPISKSAMLITNFVSNTPLLAWIFLVAVAVVLRAATFRYQKGLNKYKGPLVASFTNFWRLWQWLWYWDRPYFPDVVKYGKIIRVGPNTLLFNEPEAVKDIYMSHFSKVRVIGHPAGAISNM